MNIKIKGKTQSCLDKLLLKEVKMAIKRISMMGALVLGCFALVAMAGCGGTAQTAEVTDTFSTTETRIFSEYDFSLKYPKSLSVWQEGLLSDEANENSGIVQVAPEEGEFPLFAVSWVKTWQWGLEGGLEAGFEGIQTWKGIENVEKGELVETTKVGRPILYEVGHPMLYQYYTSTTENEGESVYGIVGAFYCNKTQRIFAIVTMNNNATIDSKQEALDNFENYLDSFVCH